MATLDRPVWAYYPDDHHELLETPEEVLLALSLPQVVVHDATALTIPFPQRNLLAGKGTARELRPRPVQQTLW